MFQTKLVNKKSYKANIGKMRLKLAKLQKSNNEAQKIKVEDLNKYKDINRVLHY